MKQALQIFPASQSAVSRLEVSIDRYQGGMVLEYTVTGDIGVLALPPFAQGARTDELWRHTCFEAFVRPLPGDAYFEFNFAPSTQWAAYGFSGTRSGMHNVEAVPSQIDARQEGQTWTLRITVDFSLVPALTAADPWRLNLTAVIEEKDGRKSYWALAHPAARPDFHNPDCFVLELPAA